MLGQKCTKIASGRADPVLLRDDHLVLLAIDGMLAMHAALGRWLDRRRTRRALADLDTHLLRDIGVTRAEALHESRRWWPSRDKSRRALAALDDSQLSNLSEFGCQVRRDARRAGKSG